MYGIGHGTRNTTVEVDKHKFTRKLTADGFETVNAAKEDSASAGDCLVGTSGALYMVEQLKVDLLKMKCDMWTITLDMCRNESKSEFRSKRESISPEDSIRKVELQPTEPVNDFLLPKIAILYGTSDLHAASDYQSFTSMLETVLRNNFLHLPFLDVAGKVNEMWEEKNIKQKSKVDYVPVGDNWNSFYWPSKLPVHPTLSEIFIQSFRFFL